MKKLSKKKLRETSIFLFIVPLISNPSSHTQLLIGPYLGWSYWMSIPGIILTTSSCLVLIVADIWTFRDKL